MSHKKGGNLVTFNNMDGPWGHYAKWKQVRERKISYDLSFMWNLHKHTHTQNKLRDRENRLVDEVGGGNEGSNGSTVFEGFFGLIKLREI